MFGRQSGANLLIIIMKSRPTFQWAPSGPSIESSGAQDAHDDDDDDGNLINCVSGAQLVGFALSGLV